MSKFKYRIRKILHNGKIEEKEIIIRASEKLDALAKIQMMYPDYEYEFIATV